MQRTTTDYCVIVTDPDLISASTNGGEIIPKLYFSAVSRQVQSARRRRRGPLAQDAEDVRVERWRRTRTSARRATEERTVRDGKEGQFSREPDFLAKL